MKPYTREDAETDLTAALVAKDLDAAWAVAGHLDRLPPRAVPSIPAAALWYAAQGLPVFPVQTGGKRPWPGSRGVKDASTDPDQIVAWWAAWPGSNIGLATGHGVDVLDFDGTQAHADWGRKFGEAWDAAEVRVLGTVSTPRAGGLHVYVPAVPGLGNRAGWVGQHVDYRGLGGYVVVPPSRTEAGVYRWVRPLAVGELR